ncbi:putative protease with the C-terminal PDZ domain [Hyella patelloides LEGE 07179]|uniref:Putative protease with the C-terminal PDZ domain n=1 Tax=Hyella patelloides LEGE 07179 TaxID=945734 RepID=A0A563VJG7_9CYAN|nr:M61 family metallopeptidase [Hyella patelloides]VEP11578.1 putative protease with the C-terminal PDZ domain [Hyella patelloides LEGE 07179]
MTQATVSKKLTQDADTVTMFYRVGMSQPASHLFEVTLQVANWQQDVLELKMPVWTPGSYLVREYARHVQDFTAQDSNARQSLKSNKVGKNHWKIFTGNSETITVKYRVFANDLTVRTNHLDRTHGYFNGAALFMFIPGLQQQPITVAILPPSTDWQISTTLNPVEGKPNTFVAADFDTLVDTPVEVGIQQVYDFEALGKPHQYVVWGEGNLKPEQLIQDTQKVIEVEAKIFGGLPYDKYLFLLHLSGSGYGGLEHKDCCTLNYPRLGFRDRDKYNRFMQLVAHEFFHLWNVKRIRPKALETFDYEQENYTTSLWFCEGATSYYDILIPLRAGIYNRKQFLKNLSKDLTRYLTIPGRNVQPLGESSFDAWIKLYRREANSDNNQISYYLKGQWVSLLLDLIIREKHHNQKSLDDVMRLLWHRYGKDEIGFTPEDLKQTIAEVAETDLTDFFYRYLNTTEEIPFDKYFAPFGLKVKSIKESEPVPYFGAKIQSENGKEVIKFVEVDSPAAIAGIDPGDEVLAIDGIRVTAQNISDRLKDYKENDTIVVSIFHQDELITVNATLAQPKPSGYEVVQIKNLSDTQKHNLSGWLG